ncbi:hypothetical protein NMY22_g6653 [Coprinellus aureogranulatus]|nr:hypothetical protein NMY22_g6653 [Coprinellus aureogranulatus]
MDHNWSDVGVFWDLGEITRPVGGVGRLAEIWLSFHAGSCPVHLNGTATSGFEIVDKIRILASRFGVIKSFKGYTSSADINLLSESSSLEALRLRSQLQSSGVSLMDVPGKPNVAEKMVVVDMLAYAFDRLPQETILVLITAEPSFSYALSFLRLRKYRVVLLAPENEETQSLLSQAPLCFNWVQNAQVVMPTPIPHEVAFCSQGSPGTPLRDNQTTEDTQEVQQHPSCDKSLRIHTDEGSVIDETPDVDLKDYLPQSQTPTDSKQVPPLPTAPASHEDAFHRHPEAFLPEGLPPQPPGHAPFLVGQSGGHPLDESMDARDGYSASALTPSNSLSPFYPQSVSSPGNVPHSPSPFESQNPTSIYSEWKSASENLGKRDEGPQIYAGQGHPCQAYTSLQDRDGWYCGSSLSAAGVNPDGVEEDVQSPRHTSGSAKQGAPDIDRLATEHGFTILVEVLRRFKSNGYIRPLRTHVALQITQKDGNAYGRAGTTKFAQYSSKAEALGLITMGGKAGFAWMALKEP